MDPELVSAIEKKSEEWKISMDEAVVKILKTGLAGPSKPSADKKRSTPATKPRDSSSAK